jgi:glutathionyl-hydroquinone reductase
MLVEVKRRYYRSHESINPTRIVPFVTILNYDEPHDRQRLFG